MVGVLLVVFIVGMLVGAGFVAANEVAPTTQTTTEISQSFITVAAEPNITDYKAGMVPILLQVRDILGNTSAEITSYSSGQISESDLILFITTQKDSLNVLLESAMRLHPPSVFAEAHLHFVKSIALLYSAMQILQDGLSQNSAALIDEATTFINQANDEVQTGTSILNSE